MSGSSIDCARTLVNTSICVICFMFCAIFFPIYCYELASIPTMPELCSFNDAWLTEDGCVCRDVKDQHIALCKVRNKSFSIKMMSKAATLSHADGKSTSISLKR